MRKKIKLIVFLIVVLALLAGVLTACKPPEDADASMWVVVDNEDNQKYKDHTGKDEAIDRATDALDNLLEYLDSTTVYDEGYYVGADILVNTGGNRRGSDEPLPAKYNSTFRLKLRANLYTYPYDQFEEGTPEYEEALAKHNEIIKRNDIIIEWFNGSTNSLMLGFYFDGVKPGSPDPGNNLYLNIQGLKRLHPNFGDTVLYQQLIRLITQFSLDSVLGLTTESGDSDDAVSGMSALLKQYASDYVVTENGEVGSLFFYNLFLPSGLTAATGEGNKSLTDYMHSIFKPFGDKLDPLSDKYLGFKFSTLGEADITELEGSARFLTVPKKKDLEKEGLEDAPKEEILSGLILDTTGIAETVEYNEELHRDVTVDVPYTFKVGVQYGLRVSSDLVFDKENYKLYEYGKYEYTGDMYLPGLDLKLDVLLRTDMNKYDNSINKVFLECRELGTDRRMIGLFYVDELTYIDIKGISELYGGIHFEDIGLPQAKKAGFDLADLLMTMSDLVDQYIVLAVDNILGEKKEDEGKGNFGSVTKRIMDNMESHMKDDDDPASRSTIKIEIDWELIKDIYSMTRGIPLTTDMLIQIVNSRLGIELDEIAQILGISVKDLVEKTFIYLTYDVDDMSIKLEVWSWAEKPRKDMASLVLIMNLYPQKIGEYVKINFGDLSKFKDLEDVMTYSGHLEGQFIFANDEIVDMSELLGVFMGDKSGLNTPYILPEAAKIDFELYYDQYIREQVLENGRWTRKGRSAFRLTFRVVEGENKTDILRIYANDVSFNNTFPIEEHGYVWLHYVCVPDMPKFKVREDLFLTSLYEYMGYDFENEDEGIVLGLTDLLGAIMEDSWVVYEPEVIRITTSNDNVKRFFNVKNMIATFDVSVRFIQQVKDVDELSREFAMYSVGDLEDIRGPSPYYIPLHEQIKVYFDFGDRLEERDLYFLYNKDSIEMESGREYYRPAIDDRFMGVTRDYLVTVTDIVGTWRISEYKEKRQDWEPLESVPTTITAYYIDAYNAQFEKLYDVDYSLHGAYDRSTGYYTVFSKYSYQNIYDFDNNVYVLSLGNEKNYNAAFKEIGVEFDEEGMDIGNVKWYYQEEVLPNDIAIRYEYNSKVPGLYVVTKIKDDPATERVLYHKDKNIYVAFDEAGRDLIKGKDNSAVVYMTTHQTSSEPELQFELDLKTMKYSAVVEIEVDIEGVVINEIKVLYDAANDKYEFAAHPVRAVNNEIVRKLNIAVGASRVDGSSDINWDSDEYNHVTFEPLDENLYDWNNSIFPAFKWVNMTWDDITLDGGLYIVKAIVGGGMMATYQENIVIKVINRVIDTQKYVMVNTRDRGLVRAPVADGIEIDPYLYLLYKAYYVNNLRENPVDFATWYLENYEVTFKFTKIYVDDPSEDTPDEVDKFLWRFDKDDVNQVYAEYQINNRNSDKNSVANTYVYTVFKNQVIALEIRVLYRKLLEIYALGEQNPGEYNIDALDENTYVLPKNLTFVFEGNAYDREKDQVLLDGSENVVIEQYRLNFENIIGTENSIFRVLPSGVPSIPGLPRGSGGLDLIKWTRDVADNVQLVNDRIDGEVRPFVGLDTNVVSSFVDFANNFDIYRAWYTEDWFSSLTVELKVNIPDKVVSTFDRDLYRQESELDEIISESETHFNIQMKQYFDPLDTSNATWGYYEVDPYDESTWVLPNEIYVYFDTNEVNQYTRRLYQVTWENLEGDSNDYLLEVGGEHTEYIIKDISKLARYFRLRAIIGDRNTNNHIELQIIVINRSGYVRSVEFLDQNGDVMNSIMEEADAVYKNYVKQFASQENTYKYEVNTYERFVLPKSYKITFTDNQQRVYQVVKWGKNDDEASAAILYKLWPLDPWQPAKTFREVTSIIGNGIKEKIFLNVITDPILPSGDLEINNINTDIASVEISSDTIEDYVNGTTVKVTIKKIDSDGMVLNKSNDNYVLIDGKKVNIYAYIKYLFSDLGIELGGREVSIVDAGTSADDMLYGMVDLQEVIRLKEQGGHPVLVFLGQGLDAHNLNVYVEIESYTTANMFNWDYLEQENVYIVDNIMLEAFNTDNTPKYPQGYVFRDHLQFSIRYLMNGKTVSFGNGGDFSLPLEWSVVPPPDGYDIGYEFTEIMGNYDVYEPTFNWYQKISSVDTVTISAGGFLWISALLPDASRVYVRLESIHIDIGLDYSSNDPHSRFVIEQGVLVIDNIYEFYPLGNNIVSQRLPSVVQLRIGNLEFSNIVWEMKMSIADLSRIDHSGNLEWPEEDCKMAQASIMGETVFLYLRVKPAVVNQIKSPPTVVGSKVFASEEKSLDGVIWLNIDIYKHLDYGGNFVLPNNLSLVYKDSSEEYLYRDIVFKYFKTEQGMERQVCQVIKYDLDGLSSEIPIVLKDTTREMRLIATLVDGQEITLGIRIYDKAIKNYVFENLGKTEGLAITINPYSDYTEVPSQVRILFAEGDDYIYEVNWNKPDRYNGFFFNTHAERITKYDGNNYGDRYEFTASLQGKDAVEDQPMTLYVYCLDYIIDSWSLVKVNNVWTFDYGFDDSYVSNAGKITNPNAKINYDNPFEEGISILPSTIYNPYHGVYEEEPETLPIFWKIVEDDLTLDGTIVKEGANYYDKPMVVEGYVYKEDGQPLGIKISLPRYEIESVSRLQGNEFAPMYSPINFIFSEITGKSVYEQYEIRFSKRTGDSPQSFTVFTKIFIPSDIDPATVKKNSLEYYPANYAYRLEWDEVALQEAKAAPASGGYSLVNNVGSLKKSATGVIYEYSRAYVTAIDLGFGMGQENQAFYIINPLAPVFNHENNGFVSSIKARGRVGLESDVLLNNFEDFILEVLWSPDGLSAPEIPVGLLGGGVNRDYPIIVRIRKKSDSNYNLTQTFKIMLVALDMSPIETINHPDQNTLNRARVRTIYNESSYNTSLFNPYMDAYKEIIGARVTRHGVTDNALNIAVIDNNLKGRFYNYEVLRWSEIIVEENGLFIQKSDQIRVMQRTHVSNIVKRVISERFEIESLNLGYGMGMDAIKFNMKSDPAMHEIKTRFVLNPLELDFVMAGNVNPQHPHVAEINPNNIVLLENGVDVTDSYSYNVIWWDSNFEDSILARKFMLFGGIIDEWVVKIEIINNFGQTVVTLGFHIELVFLDMRPDNNFITMEGADSIESEVNTSYLEDRYSDSANNPYGDYYDERLRANLNNAAVSYQSKVYEFRASAWNEKYPEEDHFVQESVSVYVLGEEFITTDPVLKRYVSANG